MTITLVRRELRLLRSLLLAFLLLPILFAIFTGILFGAGTINGNTANAMLALVNGISLPLLFAVCLACQMVAGEKGENRFAALMALPVSPTVIWRTKFLLGYCLCGVYGIILARFMPLELLLPDLTPEFHFQFVPAVLLFTYALAFLASCLTSSTLGGLFITAMLHFLWLLMNFPLTRFLASNNPQRGNAMAGLAITAGLLAMLFGYLYFRLFHRRLLTRLLPLISLLVVCCLLLPLATATYVGVLAVINDPARDAYVSPFSTPWLHDPANRENYRRVAKLAAEWHDAFPDTTALGKRIHNLPTDTVPQLTDTTLAIVRETAALREPLFAAIADQPFIAYCDAADTTLNEPFSLRTYSLVHAQRVECLAIRHDLAAGKRAAAMQRYQRMLAATEHLLDTNTIITTVVGSAWLQIDLPLFADFFPLTSGAGSPADAEICGQRLTACARAITEHLPSAILLEAVAFRDYLTLLDRPVNRDGIYPFGNAIQVKRLYDTMLQGFIERSRQPYWRHPGSRTPQPDIPLRDYLRSPLTVDVALTIAPNFDRMRSRTAAAIDVTRLGQLHLMLWRYRREHGRLPASAAELYRATGVTPFVSDLTGEPFPVDTMLRHSAVDFGWPAETASHL